MVQSPLMSYSWKGPVTQQQQQQHRHDEHKRPSEHVPFRHRHSTRTRTLELLIQSSTGRDRESTDELLKVDSAVLVLVKDLEDVVCELARVAEGEELLVDLAELGFVELAGGAVFQEAFVPAKR